MGKTMHSLDRASEQVRSFMEGFGQFVPDIPMVPDPGTQELRFDLIKEEFEEWQEAYRDGDLVEIADALCDIIYVCIGTALAYGIPIAPIFTEVHRSNMDKIGGPVREDGKILKPDGWTPPAVTDILLQASGVKQ